MFEKNAFVFYESGGICRITDIQVSPLEGMPPDKPYYILESLHDKNGVMFVPADNERIFLRAVMTKAEAEALLETLEAIAPLDTSDSKQLRAAYAECMSHHAPAEWVRVIKTVRARTSSDGRRGGRISETERLLSEKAMRALSLELSVALGESEAECVLKLNEAL